jgi:hypothetical protein
MSIWLAEGLPTWIAQMPGTLATNGDGGVDDRACGWVYEEAPIAVASDAELLELVSVFEAMTC